MEILALIWIAFIIAAAVIAFKFAFTGYGTVSNIVAVEQLSHHHHYKAVINNEPIEDTKWYLVD